MTTQISLEQLAEKLGGKLWIKGDLTRIYLDRGYNTKKMSTKTYAYQNEDGEFKVSCYIDCPSQAYQWIQSQQQEVIDGVMEDIEAAKFEISNPGVDYYEHTQKEQESKELTAARKEFEETFEQQKQNHIDYFNNCIRWKAEYDAKVAAYETMDDATRNKILELEAERQSILGTPGSAKRAKEIKNDLALLPYMPANLQPWVLDTLKFPTADAYTESKLNEKRQSLGL